MFPGAENTKMNHLQDSIRNATASIKGILRPYWKAKTLEDQDWALILVKLTNIEKSLKEFCDRCRDDTQAKTK